MIYGLQAFVRHSLAYETHGGDYYIANNPGVFHWRSGGENHINEPKAIADLQDASKRNSRDSYQKYSAASDVSTRACALRCALFIRN